MEAKRPDGSGQARPDSLEERPEDAALPAHVSADLGIDQFPTGPMLALDQWPTQPLPAIVDEPFSFQYGGMLENQSLEEMELLLQPTIERIAETGPHPAVQPKGDTGSYLAVTRNMVKASGIYALASLGPPLVALVLAPFLTHNLSPTDYGILTLLTTVIGLVAGISQLGLGSAFFRVYNYEYTEAKDRRVVLASTMLLLPLFAIPLATLASLLASPLAKLLLGSASYADLVSLSIWVVVVQNLTVPGFAWLRAENRPLFFSILSIGNVLIALGASIVLVGWLHWGVAGALAATGGGYASVVLVTLPLLLWRSRTRIRKEIVWSLLTFGVPQALSFVSYWVLQLSDRYLLSLFVSLAQVASYSVAYTLGGSVLSVLVISPFSLAWPAAMFSVAKRKDAPLVFQTIFRWFSMLLLFAAFGVSIGSTLILNWLFPKSYHSSAPIISVIAESLVFYGLYIIIMAGSNIQRKTWMPPVFTTVAALVNFALNLVLIPLYGAAGAAASTLIAYIILMLVAYVANQRIYPVPYEMRRFWFAALIGVLLYLGADILSLHWDLFWRSVLISVCLVIYGSCLLFLVGGIGPLRTRGALLMARIFSGRKGL